MHTKIFSACFAFPSLFFIHYKTAYSVSLYAVKILNHAHSVLCSVPLIKILQTFTRKFCAGSAKFIPRFVEQRAVLYCTTDSTYPVCLRYKPAAGTFIFLPYISHTQCAIHSARGY